MMNVEYFPATDTGFESGFVHWTTDEGYSAMHSFVVDTDSGFVIFDYCVSDDEWIVEQESVYVPISSY